MQATSKPTLAQLFIQELEAAHARVCLEAKILTKQRFKGLPTDVFCAQNRITSDEPALVCDENGEYMVIAA